MEDRFNRAKNRDSALKRLCRILALIASSILLYRANNSLEYLWAICPPILVLLIYKIIVQNRNYEDEKEYGRLQENIRRSTPGYWDKFHLTGPANTEDPPQNDFGSSPAQTALKEQQDWRTWNE